MEMVVSDWERPVSQEEIDAIEAAFESVSSSNTNNKRANEDGDDDGGRRRRSCRLRCLPNWENQAPSFLLPHSHRGKPEVKYPSIKFGGQVVYCRKVTEVEKAMKEIEATRNGSDQVSIGFDIEWRPIFKRGFAQRKAAVMQICGGASLCYVIHIIHSGIPPILQSFLEDSKYLKVGLGIAGDARKVFNDYNVRVKPLEDLSFLANQKLGGSPKKWSLSALTENVTCKELEKPGKIRLGNWEVDVLSKDQLDYAATDAFVSWHLYEILRSFPDAPKDDTETETEKTNV